MGTLGGAGGAASSATVGSRGAQRLGGFLAGVAAGGLAEGLVRLGLGHLVGQSRYDVLTALIDEIAGGTGDLEAVAAQSAALDVLGELLPDGTDYADLDQLALDASEVREALEVFLARYIYNRAAPVIEERLNRLEPATAEGRDTEIREYVEALVRLGMHETDPMQIDWSGPAGRATSEALLRDLYTYIEALDE